MHSYNNRKYCGFRTCFLFIGLLLIGLPVSEAAEVRLQGKVASLGGKPVVGAVVLHRQSGLQTTTGEDGSFTLALERAERLVLEVIHPDYVDGLFQVPAKSFGGTVSLVLSPLIRQSEEVVVTALRYPEPTVHIPAAATVLAETAIGKDRDANLTQVLAESTGMAPIGTGGFSMVPSIRGMARNRILILIDYARVASDRRTGPSASFISPEDIDRIEILRSPSSIFYGSDALGGVVHIFTKTARQEGIRGAVHAGYGTNGENAEYGLNLSGKTGPFSFYLSGQNNQAEDYESPDGLVSLSHYHQAGFFGRAAYETEARKIDVSFLLGRGTDIGKPAANSAGKPTWYPRENQNLTQLHWTENNVGGGSLNLMAFANPNFIETRKNTVSGGASGSFVSKGEYAKTESTEYGAQLSYSRILGECFRLTGGVDLFGRAEAGAVNIATSYNEAGTVTKLVNETAYNEGKRRDLGFYLSADFTGVKNLDLIAGLRYDLVDQNARPGGGGEVVESNRDAVTGFFGASYRVTDHWTVFANFSRAYRAPGLGELFYSGITGRGVIIANPGLTPETSLNGDLGVRYIGKRFYAGLYGFLYNIDDLIDRYLVAENVYAYLNVEDVQIKGIEFELEYHPVAGLKLFGNGAFMDGESRLTGDPVNDIPPFRLFAGGRYQWRGLSFEITGMHQSAKDIPGPAEIAIPAYTYFQARVGYNINTAISLFALVKNALNEAFLGRPDPDGVFEPGRNIVFGARYRF
ncbi:MAG: TonB-dependent receptor [Candidatus Aminicenantes bacterium]|nr:TonB-dependent receptor [Candidatus Aminicenantes bacterium]